MTCPVCGENTEIYHSTKFDCDVVLRHRRCAECGHRFMTEEKEIPEKTIRQYRKRWLRDYE